MRELILPFSLLLMMPVVAFGQDLPSQKLLPLALAQEAAFAAVSLATQTAIA